MSDPTASATTRPPAAVIVGVLAVVGALGSGLMTLGHLGLDLPLLEAFGPGRLLAPVAAAFAVGTVLYVVVAYAAFTLTSWAWPVALVVNAVAFLTAAFPYRGWVSGAAIAVSLASIVVLVTPAGRAALRR